VNVYFIATLDAPPCWAIRIAGDWATGRNAHGAMLTSCEWWMRKLWQDKAQAMAEMWALRAAGRPGVRCVRVTRLTRSR